MVDPTSSSNRSCKRALKTLDDNFSSIQVNSQAEDPSEIDNFSMASHALNALSDLVVDDDDDDDEEDQSRSSQRSAATGAVAVEQIAQKETQKVARWKTFVMFLLLVNAGLVTVATFEFLSRQEEDEFQSAFRRAAQTVSDASHYHAHSLIDSLDAFSQSVTSYALDTKVEWPLFTLPHFEERVSFVRHATFFDLFGILPIVQEPERKAWEAYASYKQSWLQESYDALANNIPANGIHSGFTNINHTHSNQDDDNFRSRNLQNDDDTTIDKQSLPLIPPYIHNGSLSMEDHNNGNSNNNSNSQPTLIASMGHYAPIWQLSPPPPQDMIGVINADLMSSPFMASLMSAMYKGHLTVSRACHFDLYNETVQRKFFGGISVESETLSLAPSAGAEQQEHREDDVDENATMSSEQIWPKLTSNPQSVILQPLFDSFDKRNRNIRAFSWGILPWEKYFADLLPHNVDGVICVVKNSCGQVMTFAVDGPQATFLGEGDLHEPKFEHLVVVTELEEFWHKEEKLDHGQDHHPDKGGACFFSMHIYPSFKFREPFITSRPEYFTLGIATIFLVTGTAFFVFVYVSRNRQRKVMAIALGTSQIVASMFPAGVREKVLKEAEEQAMRRLEEGRLEVKGTERGKDRISSNTQQGTAVTAMLSSDDGSAASPSKDMHSPIRQSNSRPIADVFDHVTIMMSDIVGFTSWASVREPSQVFELLETIYTAFDSIAKRRRVYKIETIGDCYVAVAGLPTPRDNHAIIMCRFARECLATLETLTKQLERSLGPDTGELTMRFGLHSGPVTAGVLRGERARYQIFGDTVNMAARMESNCLPGRIQISQDTAELLAAAKKSAWFTPRENKIVAKGKGELQTYWVHSKREEHDAKSEGASSDTDSLPHNWLDIPANLFASATPGSDTLRAHLSEQHQRLAEWNSNQLLKLLNQVLVVRKAKLERYSSVPEEQALADVGHQRWAGESAAVIDEVQYIITMPDFDPAVFPNGTTNDTAELSEIVIQQLHDYVSIICSMHNKNNPFHSYHHTSHTTMNCVKLLSRLSSIDGTHDGSVEKELHERSFGIATDPLAQFSLAFATLIHNVDHPGVENAQHVLEGSRLARIYNYVSINEQNSFTVAWDLLMDPMFDDLRKTIYTNREEYCHFRAIVVNAVLATDLHNKDANAARNLRWEKAFYNRGSKEDLGGSNAVATINSQRSSNGGRWKENLDQKATLLLEYMAQASDVCNIMQHWHLFRKWNERRFKEMCRAYQQGRARENPVDVWYHVMLEFFDTVAIPLAQKLKESKAFGSYADECLKHATQNREEWLLKGTTVVQTMEQNFAEKHNDKAPKTPSRTKIADHSASPPCRRSGICRSRSEDSVMPTLDDLSVMKDARTRRKSIDHVPRTPRRSLAQEELMDPAKVVAEMFSQLPDLRREKSSDGAPLQPRRSRDVDGMAEDAETVSNMYTHLTELERRSSDDIPQRPTRSNEMNYPYEHARELQTILPGMPQMRRRKSYDNIPRNPRRSHDFVDLIEDASVVRAMFSEENSVEEKPKSWEGARGNEGRRLPNKMASLRSDPTNSVSTTLDTSSNTLMSNSMNSHSLAALSTDTPIMGLGSGSGSHHRSDMSPRTPVRRRPNDDESTVHTMELIPEKLPSSGSDEGDGDNTASNELDRSMVDSLISDNDESTLLTMGNLWASANLDDSTTFTKSVV